MPKKFEEEEKKSVPNNPGLQRRSTFRPMTKNVRAEEEAAALDEKAKQLQ